MPKFPRKLELNMKALFVLSALAAILASVAILVACISHRNYASSAKSGQSGLSAESHASGQASGQAGGQAGGQGTPLNDAMGSQGPTDLGSMHGMHPPSARGPPPPLHPSTVGPEPGWNTGGGGNAGNAGIVDVRIHSGSPPMDPWALAVGEPFAQVGYVFSKSGSTQMPLYARPAPYHRNGRMQYYVSTKEGHVQVSARVNDRDCAEQLGCEELYNGDTVAVPELGENELVVKLYAR